MSEGKKYNAFTGVFTPSLLTILGVIMYLRLGWVVGQAGIWGALSIILLAHVISVTTGLSISSIATDKKIKTGGIYYILSRSLGLPMGGAIGIALFLGTALSISLYIIGFAESFLAIDGIRDFFGLQADINGYRIVGSTIIVILVIVAFISTSLAMKMQFFILIAIALSLISVGVGLFQNGYSLSSDALSWHSTGKFPLEILFAIFFPAVTGFTAGVAMSGDLQDPKKAIPKGTIFAISAGFLVYLFLALGTGFFVSQDDLTSNYNILSKIAWFAPLVVAGIWGATLSSALGGILGGPRILQAIARDRLMPKLFGKGYGSSDEPRNALLLIFAIAEGGVLIGELDIIAGVVSMFYLASYGFINLSYVLEKWASTDFRPTFKIHIAFGVIGFIASFAVMFKLDMTSMLASFVIMGLIYFILKRREIRSESGDVWQSVWASIIRRSFSKMDDKTIEERNWKPNIILFTGPNQKRPYLLSFGKALIGRYGLLSNFELYDQDTESILFAKNEQTIKYSDENTKGVFTRRQSCANIYQGIEQVSQTYGFAGVEPNTVLMGWARHTKDPDRFVKMLQNLSQLDLNILLLDYSKTEGFGKNKQIDIWWRGAGNHGNLSLTLTKFLLSSEIWGQSKIRLLIVNYENDKMELIREKASNYLENMRIDAELIIFNNEIEQKPFYDIMKAESVNSDLVFLGISEIDTENPEKFVQETNDLMHKIGSVVLVKASKMFKELKLGVEQKSTVVNKITPMLQVNSEHSTIEWPKQSVLAEQLSKVNISIERQFENTFQNLYQLIVKENHKLLTLAEESYFQSLKGLQKTNQNNSTCSSRKIHQQQSAFISKLHKQIEQFKSESLSEEALLLNKLLPQFNENTIHELKSAPKILKLRYDKGDYKQLSVFNFEQKQVKFFKLIFSGRSVNYRLNFRKLLENHIFNNREQFLLKHLKHFGLMQVQFALELLKIAKLLDNSYVILSEQCKKGTLVSKHFEEQKLSATQYFNQLHQLNTDISNNLINEFLNHKTEKFNYLNRLFNNAHPNSFLPEEELEKPKVYKPIIKQLNAVPNLWKRNQKLIYNAVLTEIRLLSIKSKLKGIFSKLTYDLNNAIQTYGIDEYRDIKDAKPSTINAILKRFEAPDLFALNNKINQIYNEAIRALNRSYQNIPDQISIFEDDKLNEFAEQQYNQIPSTKVAAKQLIDYLLKNKVETQWLSQQDQFILKLQHSFSKLDDAIRLLSLSVGQKKGDIDEKTFEEAFDQIRIAFENTETNLEQLTDLNQSIFTDISQQLSYYTFIKTASNLKQYIQQQKKQTKQQYLINLYSQIKHSLSQAQVDLIYTKSKAKILRKTIESSDVKHNKVKVLQDFSLQVSPSKAIQDQLPFYYQQLFNSSQILHNDFWIGHRAILEEADETINRYKDGFKGAIVITGANGSGKSFFSHRISQMYGAPTYWLNATDIIAPEPSILLEQLQKATEQPNDAAEIFQNMTPSCFIIDELGSWFNWDYDISENITEIFNWIEQFNNKHLFILTVNQSINRTFIQNSAWAELIINTIVLKDHHAQNLKDIILKRHRTSGLNLILKGKKLEDWNEIRLAAYFNQLYKHTHGNVGASLLFWLASIQKFEDKSIYVQWPDIDTNGLEALNQDDILILTQLIKFKKSDVNHLSMYLKLDPIICQKKINYLIRSGLVIQDHQHYKTNPYVLYFLDYQFTQKSLI
ncbi:MAG: amino acid permease [Bacteroidales bacterium]|nr:amino acid permease [Bacteroidales bacterium]